MNYYSHIEEFKYKDCKNYKKIFVSGWCFREDGKTLSYYLKFDNEKHFLNVNKISREDVLVKYNKSFENSNIGFSAIIDIPSIKFNNIIIGVENNEEDFIIVSKKYNEIIKFKDDYPFEYNIDTYSIENDECNVLGWMFSLDDDDLNINVIDSCGNKCNSSIHWSFRPDVGDKYNLKSERLCCGFAINFKYQQGKNYKLKVNNSTEEFFIEIFQKKKMKTLVKEYLTNLNSENFKKAISYLKMNGVRKFASRLTLGVGKKKLTYSEWFNLYSPSEAELKEQKEHIFVYAPKISLIVATYNTPLNFLRDMIDSVCNQTYSNWELCIADGSTNLEVEEYVQQNYNQENRIKFKKLKNNYGIAENMNAALDMVSGDYIGLFDHDDLLTENALFEVVKSLQNKKYEIIYSDEDKYITDTKMLTDPHFKPDFNLDLMRSVNYICHFYVVKKDLVDKVGKFNKDFDGAQDYDFMLRCIETTQEENIYHIPKILYHWRMHFLSTASNPESKMYAFEAGKRAIQAHLDRLNIDAEVFMHDFLGLYRVKYKVQGEPLISILIPNKDHIDDLQRCIDSIYRKSKYNNYEIIVIENNSVEDKTFEFYKQLIQENENTKVVYWDREFNYSSINNYGATFAKGEYLLLLNNDTEIINPDCIEEMLSMCQRNEVGIVGARLYYEDDTIQHAGVIVGFGGIAGHSFVGNDKDEPGYFGRQVVVQDLSAVTAACLMVKKELFDKVDGLNEDLQVAFNDIDFCLKIRELGYLVVYDPYVQLYHYESKSRGSEDTPEKVQRFNNEIQTFRERWNDILEKGDPYYNPNLTYMGESFTLKE